MVVRETSLKFGTSASVSAFTLIELLVARSVDVGNHQLDARPLSMNSWINPNRTCAHDSRSSSIVKFVQSSDFQGISSTNIFVIALESKKATHPFRGARFKFPVENLGQGLDCPRCKTPLTPSKPEGLLKVERFFCEEYIEFPTDVLI